MSVTREQVIVALDALLGEKARAPEVRAADATQAAVVAKAAIDKEATAAAVAENVEAIVNRLEELLGLVRQLAEADAVEPATLRAGVLPAGALENPLQAFDWAKIWALIQFFFSLLPKKPA